MSIIHITYARVFILIFCQLRADSLYTHHIYTSRICTLITCFRKQVLSKFPTRNMNDFAVEASRIGTRDWLDLQVILILIDLLLINFQIGYLSLFASRFLLSFRILSNHTYTYRTERTPSPPSRLPWVPLRRRSRHSRQSISRSFASSGVPITLGSRSHLRSIRKELFRDTFFK